MRYNQKKVRQNISGEKSLGDICLYVREIEIAPIFLVFWLALIVTFKYKGREDRLCSDHYA